MSAITVTKLDETKYRVVVESGSRTEHQVTLQQAYFQKLTGGRATPEQLIERSFEFLLEREPNTSILRTFDLPLIAHYFPDYEATMTALFKQRT